MKSWPAAKTQMAAPKPAPEKTMPEICSRFSTNQSAMTLEHTAWVPKVMEKDARKPAM